MTEANTEYDSHQHIFRRHVPGILHRQLLLQHRSELLSHYDRVEVGMLAGSGYASGVPTQPLEAHRTLGRGETCSIRQASMRAKDGESELGGLSASARILQGLRREMRVQQRRDSTMRRGKTELFQRLVQQQQEQQLFHKHAQKGLHPYLISQQQQQQKPSGWTITAAPAPRRLSMVALEEAQFAARTARTTLSRPVLQLQPFVSSLNAVLLFADMSGFTLLASRLGAEDAEVVVNAFFSRIIRVIHAHGGEVRCNQHVSMGVVHHHTYTIPHFLFVTAKPSVSLKYTQIHSNTLKYTQIHSNTLKYTQMNLHKGDQIPRGCRSCYVGGRSGLFSADIQAHEFHSTPLKQRTCVAGGETIREMF
jgi:hypothetical protein